MSSTNHTQTYQIQGLHCGGCVSRVSKALSPFGAHVSVTLDPPRVTIEGSKVNLQTLQDTLNKVGDYTLTPLDVKPQQSKSSFGLMIKPIYLVLGVVIVLVMIGLTR